MGTNILGVGPEDASEVGVGMGGVNVGGLRPRRSVCMGGVEGDKRRCGGRGWAHATCVGDAAYGWGD